MISDPERFRRLRGLPPVEAVAAWLRGDFGIGDDVAMIEAIRRDERIKCPDEAIASYFMAASPPTSRRAAEMKTSQAANLTTVLLGANYRFRKRHKTKNARICNVINPNPASAPAITGVSRMPIFQRGRSKRLQ